MRGNKGIGDVRIHAPHITKEMTARADNTMRYWQNILQSCFSQMFLVKKKLKKNETKLNKIHPITNRHP